MDPYEALVALVALTSMEIVLGIDNIVFITILTSRLPAAQQPSARKLGLLLALGMRLLLLFFVSHLLEMTNPVFHVNKDLVGYFVRDGGPNVSQHGHHGERAVEAPPELADFYTKQREIKIEEISGVSWKDLILIAGGLFLIWKSVTEIHNKIQGEEHGHGVKDKVSYTGVLVQIGIMDIVFSLDSVITAVGMAKGWVIYVAVILAVGVMIVFAEKVSWFVSKNPTLKILALSFLILIGVLLVAEGIGTGLDKGYIYFAMAFGLLVEVLNLKMKSRHAKLAVDTA